MTLDQITTPTGEELAQAGMTQVLDNELDAWKTVVLRHVEALPVGFRFTPEWIVNRAGMPPKHPNSMGAMLRHLAGVGLIKWTGEVRKSQRPDRHAGIVRVWERIVRIPKWREDK